MSMYYNEVGETREIDDALYAVWVASGFPEAQSWTLQPQPPSYDPQTHECTWNGTQWVVSALPPPTVPVSVPAHKWRMALRAAGYRAAYETHVTAASANAQDY